MSGYELKELATRSFHLDGIGPCDYILWFARDEGVFRVAAFNVTEGRPVTLCEKRDHFATTNEDVAESFWKQISRVRSTA